MSKNDSERPLGDAQPMMKGVNLAKYLIDVPEWCLCLCPGCPPWQHAKSECRLRCEWSDENTNPSVVTPAL